MSDRRVGRVEWPDKGVRDVEVTLDRECYYDRLPERCRGDEHCVEGSIQLYEVPDEFVFPTSTDEDVRFWSDE